MKRKRTAVTRCEKKDMNRRTFLKKGAAAGGGLLASPMILAACGRGEEAQTRTGEFELDADEQVTISYWHIFPSGNDILRDVNSRFMDENPNITVEMRQIPGGNYQTIAQEVQASLAAGNPPAVAQVGYDALWNVAGNLPHLNIEEAARLDPEGGQEWLSSNFAGNILDLGRVDGTLHFLPYSVASPVLYYNQDALEQADIDSPPRTWSEVRDYARRIAEGTDMTGLITSGPGLYTLQALSESNGARVLIDAGDGYRCGVDSPESIEAMRLLAEMTLEDETASVLDQAQLAQVTENFASGQAAMMLSSIASLGSVRDSASFMPGTVPFPTFGDKPRRVPTSGNALGIFAEDEAQQAAAWLYIKHLLSPEALTTWDENTGYVPPRQGLADDPQYLGSYYEENPAAKTGLDQLPEAVPFVNFPGDNGPQATVEVNDAWDRIFTGEQEVAPALEAAARRVNDLIQQ